MASKEVDAFSAPVMMRIQGTPVMQLSAPHSYAASATTISGSNVNYPEQDLHAQVRTLA
jgi:hypothetical protein